MKKIALIFGVTGQDGAYLSELLLKKNYIVHGVKRRTSLINTKRIDHLYKDPNEKKTNFYLHHGDLTDSTSITNLIKKTGPHEIYNLGAQSHVGVSFEIPEYTANSTALGSLRILESLRILGLKKTKYYQASSSEMFGRQKKNISQNEKTVFRPMSIYAVSKVFSYHTSVYYRDAYGIFACNGILFNHESPRRGETFVTRKITRGLSRIVLGVDTCLYLGNLDALRDWGHAKDFVKMQWLMLQQEKPNDYVIATGEQYSVREFVNLSTQKLGIKIDWIGSGFNERAVVKKLSGEAKKFLSEGDIIIKVDKRYYRPTEVETLLGNAEKARKELNWSVDYSIEDIVDEMIDFDLELAKKEISNTSKSHN